jgi:NAD(P)-dependent dehydrogenase (short-subunit alcohol dehydrogenase family)
MTHPVFAAGRTAVVTGAALGIGRAACRRFASLGMKLCMVDIDDEALDEARAEVVAGSDLKDADVLAVAANVARLEDLTGLRDAVAAQLGPVALLMNNAVTRLNAKTWEEPETWRRALDINLFGVINGVQAFLPAMLADGAPAMVVNVGSKQGITNPPANPPYNVAKAAVKFYTELLQHELRNAPGARVTAHLLIPGMTTTGRREHRPGAWMSDQVVEFMMAALDRGDFYILCPDEEVTPAMDRKRILWGAGDIIENRPALSRWDANYTAIFEKWDAEPH